MKSPPVTSAPAVAPKEKVTGSTLSMLKGTKSLFAPSAPPSGDGEGNSSGSEAESSSSNDDLLQNPKGSQKKKPSGAQKKQAKKHRDKTKSGQGLLALYPGLAEGGTTDAGAAGGSN